MRPLADWAQNLGVILSLDEAVEPHKFFPFCGICCKALVSFFLSQPFGPTISSGKHS